MGYFAEHGGFERHTDRFSPLAIRAAERELHQGKNRVNELLRGTQREAKDAFEHQYGGKGEFRITLRAAPRRSFGFVIPGLNG